MNTSNINNKDRIGKPNTRTTNNNSIIIILLERITGFGPVA